MSNIANRMMPGFEGGFELNGVQFSTIMMAYLLGDISALQAENRVNALLAMNGATALNAAEITELGNMKSSYDSLNSVGKAEYRDKLVSYTQFFQESQSFPNEADKITVAQWDTVLGVV